jgi:hypothetical protein
VRPIIILFLLFLFCISKKAEKNSTEGLGEEQIPSDCYQLILFKPARFLPGLINTWDTLILKKSNIHTEDTMYLGGGAAVDTNTMKKDKFYKINFEMKHVEELGSVKKIILSLKPYKKE